MCRVHPHWRGWGAAVGPLPQRALTGILALFLTGGFIFSEWVHDVETTNHISPDTADRLQMHPLKPFPNTPGCASAALTGAQAQSRQSLWSPLGVTVVTPGNPQGTASRPFKERRNLGRLGFTRPPAEPMERTWPRRRGRRG
jgi:hypothetical protein